MEYVAGRTLAAWIKHERPRWRQVLGVMKQALQGVMAAHAEGLLHRDIKPENIMVGDDGRVRVMDFGLARVDAARDSVDTTGALSIELTIVGAVLGTPAYMAPEQHLGQAADERTDQFSLAVTLWEALYRQRPYTGETLAEFRLAVTTGRRSTPPAGIKVPAWLRRVVERALEVDRNKRFESVRVMLETIENGEQRARTRLITTGLALGVLILGAVGIMAIIQSRIAAASEARALQSEALAKQNEARALESEASANRLVEQLEREKRAFKQALSVQRGLRATMLIPEDREAEALRLAVQSVAAYGPDWSEPPPPEATAGLATVLAEDAAIVTRAMTLKGHARTIWELAYSPDGTQLATASRDSSAKIWDARSGALLTSLEGHNGSVQALAYSPDGARIATASFDKTAKIWDARTGALLNTLAGHAEAVFSLTSTMVGRFAASM